MDEIPNVHALLDAGRLVLSVEETAVALGVSRGTAYQATRTGDLPSRRIGRRIVVPIAELLAWCGEVNANGNGAHPNGLDGSGNE